MVDTEAHLGSEVNCVTGIIGAGPSGLALNLFLKQPSEILEGTSQVGGHASSFTKDGFTYDLGPHILFSRDKAILNFIVATLGENVQQCVRKNKISFAGKLIKYPFENDLANLPMQARFECLYGFVNNPYKAQYAKPQNLREWLLSTFGEGICKHYLFPYNEKVWNVPVEDLSMLWAERIPNPPMEDVVKSALGWETEGYLHQLYYHYPKTGGYQAISEGWAGQANVKFGETVHRIHSRGKGFEVETDKGRHSYDQIVTSMAIQHLVEIVDFPIPDDIRKAVKDLIVNPMYVVSLGIRGEDKEKYTAIYFPEDDYLVNRVSFPCTFSDGNGPKGHYSIQAEITCKASSEEWGWSDERILEHVIDGLVKKNVLASRDLIVSTDVRRKDRSYVVYDKHYQGNVDKIRPFFGSKGVHLLGRFSHFEYINIDQVVQRALEMAAKLNGEDIATCKQTYLDAALARLGKTAFAVR
ncbi:FAD-dependent oxidoreductase [bacterium]|nr:FAD-dependent oxidoreductase [bacterium]